MGAGITPQKRWGQHFLRSGELAVRIVEALHPEEGDVVLEIGPGEGMLTESLLHGRAERVLAVEIDERCCEHLANRFGHDERFELIRGDILDTAPCGWVQDEQKLRVIGNLPYYLTSPILFHLWEQRDCIRDIVVTVQKEVGDRIVSPPGSKAYGIPSVLFQAFGRVERLFPIPRAAFRPAPGVESTVIRLTFYEDPPYPIEDVGFFRKLVRTVFGQRRKMLRNTLKNLVEDENALQSLPLDLSRRPEDLSVAEFVQLSHELSNR